MKKISIKDLKFEKNILAQLSDCELSSLKGGVGTGESINDCVSDICMTTTDIETSETCAPDTVECTPIGTLDCGFNPPNVTNGCTAACGSFACMATMFVQCSE